MRARVLGSGAGGGVPQWNCACEHCSLARRGDPRVLPRTQDSVAIAAGAMAGGGGVGVGAGDGPPGGEAWMLVNASPDVLRQIERFAPLWPRRARHTPIAAIALTNGDLDHVTGLLSLRESQPLRILATRRVRAGLCDHNAFLRTLARTEDQVRWVDLELGRETILDDVGLAVTAIPLRGKLPVHLAGVLEPSPEDNVALRVRDLRSDALLAIATAVGDLDGVEPLARGADTLLLDGTFWSEDEIVSQGLGKARARDMAHVPVGGPDGSLARLGRVAVRRRVYTHINNTNPILREGSPERAAVESAGWEVAFDGMDLPS
jgi:pyrroloquinoline quinone biosynthesis protein B